MGAATNFRTLRRHLAPRWLLDGEGGLVGESLDTMKDAFAERVRLGLLSRFPQNDGAGATAPPDALVAQGRDRRVVRGISETDTQYAVRLTRWLDERKTAGNPYTLMRQLAAYCGPLPAFRTVDCRGNWYSRTAGGYDYGAVDVENWIESTCTQTSLLDQGNWDWDGEGASRWSRFWVIIYPNGLWDDGLLEWGNMATPAWGTVGTVWGTSVTQEQSATLRFIISDWKPAGTTCPWIVLAFDGASFDPASAYHAAGMPDGTWEKGYRITAGVAVPSRLDTARYLPGVIR